MLRDGAWIEDYGAAVGGTVFLDLEHLGAVGVAEVLAVESSPPVEEGPGRVVTGTFRHDSGTILDLVLAGEDEPLGVTGTHPFWSVDRETWVPAADLSIGETLETLTGTTSVESIETRAEPELVYNIEVDGDHCYRVGECGVLVHNASVEWKYEDGSPKSNGTCGGAIANYEFTVPDNATGMIIQKVEIVNQAKNCDGTEAFVPDITNQPLGYFEAWNVKNGVIYVGASMSVAFPPQDSFRITNVGPGTEGTIQFKATLAFVKGCSIDEAKWTGTDKRSLGLPNLPLTSPPTNWPSNGPSRSLVSQWRCCGDDNDMQTDLRLSSRYPDP